MDRLLPFDELNKISAKIRDVFSSGEQKEKKQDILMSMYDLFVLSYIYGDEAANTMLGTDFAVNTAAVDDSVTKRIAGKDWVQRANEYIERGTAADLIRVIETDAHRIYNDAIYSVAEEAAESLKAAGDGGGHIYKTWECMMLPTSRDTHVFLDGTTIPLDEKFYTYDGASAYHPGDFGEASEDVNCLCRLRLTKV